MWCKPSVLPSKNLKTVKVWVVAVLLLQSHTWLSYPTIFSPSHVPPGWISAGGKSQPPFPVARTRKMFSINTTKRFSTTSKSRKGRFPSIVASGLICLICGAQLDKNENLENQQRPQFSYASGRSLLNPGHNQTAIQSLWFRCKWNWKMDWIWEMTSLFSREFLGLSYQIPGVVAD